MLRICFSFIVIDIEIVQEEEEEEEKEEENSSETKCVHVCFCDSKKR